MGLYYVFEYEFLMIWAGNRIISPKKERKKGEKRRIKGVREGETGKEGILAKGGAKI